MPSHLHCRCVNINKFCDEMILTSLIFASNLFFFLSLGVILLNNLISLWEIRSRNFIQTQDDTSLILNIVEFNSSLWPDIEIFVPCLSSKYNVQLQHKWLNTWNTSLEDNPTRMSRPPYYRTPEEYKSATTIVLFGFVFDENWVREITWLSWRYRFQKAPFSRCFLSTRKPRVPSVSKFCWFEERVQKAFSWRGRLIAAFSNFSGVEWTRPEFDFFFKLN